MVTLEPALILTGGPHKMLPWGGSGGREGLSTPSNTSPVNAQPEHRVLPPTDITLLRAAETVLGVSEGRGELGNPP